MDILSGYGNIDVILGVCKTNSIERELDSIINGSEGELDLEPLPNRENSSQENEIRDIGKRNELGRGLPETNNILSDELNARFSREMDSLMDLMQSLINKAISSSINDRVVPEIQNIMKFAFESQWSRAECVLS